MAVQTTQYAAAEIAARGNEIYEHDIRPRVETGNFGKVVAIDIHTGDYEVADDVLTSARRLRLRQPDAEIWFVRIGHRALHHIRFFAGAE